MNESAHGSVGTHLEKFSRLVPARKTPFADEDLIAIAKEMDRPDTLSDGPDAEENLFVPAGYTYFGQFIDHDLTLETTSNLNPDEKTPPTNLRTPAFDLDCVYGNGPSDQTYLYEPDLATLRIGTIIDDASKDDLLRNVDRKGKVDSEGRAIIGDKRNDENSIVSQVQLAMIKFHNKVVKHLAAQPNPPADLFKAASNEVRWTYQRVLVEDYLTRIVEGSVYDAFVAQRLAHGDEAYLLYPPKLRNRIPLEFAGAAYRFGHSMVRLGYRLNRDTALEVFTHAGESRDSLTGFQPLPASHVIDDWGRFFPAPDNEALWPGVRVNSNTGSPQVAVRDGGNVGNRHVRLQFAYKIDPSVTAPLDDLPARISGFDGGTPVVLKPKYKGPALSLLNLRRGNKFELASGQSVAAFLDGKNGAKLSDLQVSDLQIRAEAGDKWTFQPYPPGLQQETPLWAYVLAEAQRKLVRQWAAAPNNRAPVDDDFFLNGEPAHTQLGPVGGRIVLETFFGLLDADRTSFVYAPATWTPLVTIGKTGPVTFSRILDWTGLKITDGFGV